MDEIKLLLCILFDKAKNYDEFSEWEFIQTIMRDKLSNNMYTAAQVINNADLYAELEKNEQDNPFKRQILEDNLKSAWTFIEIGSNLTESFDEMIRIRLLTYAYITEIKYIQNILANLLWISIGGNFYPDPFDGTIVKKMLNPNEIDKLTLALGIDANKFDTLRHSEKRFKLICFLCEKAGILPIKEYIDSFYDNHFRNSISHSKYFVSKNGYVGVDEKCKIVLSSAKLAEKIDKCIMLFISLTELLQKYNDGYSGKISIKGRNINYNKNNIDNGDIVNIDIVAKTDGGIITTIIKSGLNNNDSNDKDEFYEDIVKFIQEFDYDQDCET